MQHVIDQPSDQEHGKDDVQCEWQQEPPILGGQQHILVCPNTGDTDLQSVYVALSDDAYWTWGKHRLWQRLIRDPQRILHRPESMLIRGGFPWERSVYRTSWDLTHVRNLLYGQPLVYPVLIYRFDSIALHITVSFARCSHGWLYVLHRWLLHSHGVWCMVES